jgi:hypothetical protein
MSITMNPGEMWKIEYRDEEDCLFVNHWLILNRVDECVWSMVFLGGDADECRGFFVGNSYQIQPDFRSDSWVRL